MIWDGRYSCGNGLSVRFRRDCGTRKPARKQRSGEPRCTRNYERTSSRSHFETCCSSEFPEAIVSRGTVRDYNSRKSCFATPSREAKLMRVLETSSLDRLSLVSARNVHAISQRRSADFDTLYDVSVLNVREVTYYVHTRVGYAQLVEPRNVPLIARKRPKRGPTVSFLPVPRNQKRVITIILTIQIVCEHKHAVLENFKCVRRLKLKR